MSQFKLELSKYSTEEIRHRKVLNTTYLACGGVHVLFLVIFIYYGITELLIFNIFSPGIYVVCYLLNTRNKLVLAAAVGITEATTHAILSVLLLGWDSGFHYYILLVFILIYFLVKLNFTSKVLFSIPIFIIYLALYIYTRDYTPKYEMNESIIIGFSILNISLTIIVFSLFSIIYTFIIKRIEDMLVMSEKKQRLLNIERNKFISVFSHDLKDPVSAIKGFSELLMTKYETLDNTKIQLYLNRINISVKDAISQINNLVDWTKAQSGEINVRNQKIKLEQLMNEVLDFYSEQASEKQIVLHAEIEKNIMVNADYEMMRTVIYHLVSNAIKYTYEGGRVDITADSDKDNVIILVKDTGIGIPSKSLPKIFDIEHKLIRRGTQNETGTGLGLIISNEFIHLNKGEIILESDERQGTIAKIILPSISSSHL